MESQKKKYQRELTRKEKEYQKELEKKEKKHQRELVRKEKEYRKELNKELHKENKKWAAQIRENKRREKKKYKPKKYDPQKARILKEAHEGKAVDYVIENFAPLTAETFLKESKPEVLEVLGKTQLPIKVQFKLHCIFEHTNHETGEKKEEKMFISVPSQEILTKEDIEEAWEYAKKLLLQTLYNSMVEKSGLTIKSILGLHMFVSKHDFIDGSSYIELSPYYKNKKSIINVLNYDDNMCGKWAITMSLNMDSIDKNHIGRVTKEVKKLSKNYNWSDIKFPLTLEGIKIFEKNNKDIGVVVYTTVGDSGEDLLKITPLFITKKTLSEDKIAKIFIIHDHYCVVSNESGFLNNGENNKTIICRRCGYKAINTDNGKNSAKNRMESHLRYCEKHDYCRETFPSVDKNILKFKKYEATIKHPITITFDFEDLLIRTKGKRGNTRQFQKHVPYSVGMYISRFDGKNEYFSHVGLDAPKVFSEKLDKITKDWYEEFKTPKPMKNVKEANSALERETKCWICKKDFGEDANLKPVRDHCHFTGNFRGIAHACCNKLAKRPTFIPCFAHNLNYDEKAFLRELVKSHGYIDIIPKNEETFISFCKKLVVDSFTDENGKKKEITREIRFLDSFRFMSSSLDNLVKNMSKESLKNLRKEFPNKEQFDVVVQKGIFFYDYMNSIDKLEETSLPKFKIWFNKMTRKYPTFEEFERTKMVWKVFECKKLRDYRDIYLKTDVLLLSDVLESFRNMSLKNYGLDPVHFYTSPSLGWNALLKITGVKFELFTENQSEMYRMVETGIRGGVTNCPTRYAKANNIYMKNYNENEKNSFIKYLDKNSLYGGVMWSMPLPINGFEWMDEDENWENICKKEGKGCILEVDLKYPEELHDYHNEFPLAPEKEKKLTPNLRDKKHYVLHYKNLKCYLKQGLELVKIHRGIKFNESCWMKPYIDINNKLRKEAKNEFEKDFFKLMNNAPFGKCLENVRNRVNIQVGTNDNFSKFVKKPSFKSRTILSEDMSLIHFKKLEIKLNKPITLGMSILDLSKVVMVEFYYNYLKPKYGNKVKLLYTDTDSLILHIETKDFYEDIKNDVNNEFDTSNFPENHPAIKIGFKIGVNKKVPLMMKDECGGIEIVEFVGLSPKVYAIKKDNNEESKRVKGIKKCIREQLTCNTMNRCRKTEKSVIKEMTIFRSRNHIMYTEKVNKIALSSKDEKRIILEDKTHTLAPGHWRVKENVYIPNEILYPNENLGKLALKAIK